MVLFCSFMLSILFVELTSLSSSFFILRHHFEFNFSVLFTSWGVVVPSVSFWSFPLFVLLPPLLIVSPTSDLFPQRLLTFLFVVYLRLCTSLFLHQFVTFLCVPSIVVSFLVFCQSVLDLCLFLWIGFACDINGFVWLIICNNFGLDFQVFLAQTQH